jgi:hypothetical protein
MIDVVLSIAGRNGDRALWDRLHALAKAEKDQKMREHLLGAMSSFNDIEIVKANLEVMLAAEFDVRETMYLFFSAMGEETRELGWAFMKEHFDAYVDTLPKPARAYLMYTVVSFCDEEHRAEAQTFFQPRADKLLGGPRVLQQVLESMSICIAQKKLHQESVVAFIKRAGKGKG